MLKMVHKGNYIKGKWYKQKYGNYKNITNINKTEHNKENMEIGDAAAECLEYTSSAFSAEFNLENKSN